MKRLERSYMQKEVNILVDTLMDHYDSKIEELEVKVEKLQGIHDHGQEWDFLDDIIKNEIKHLTDGVVNYNRQTGRYS